MVSQVIRVRDWRSRLTVALDRVAAQPFAWGHADCLLGLVAPVTEALTEADLWAAWRGRYATARGALRVMHGDGFDTLADLAASVLPEVHPSCAGEGDIAAIPTGDGFGYALGVVSGANVIVLSPRGPAALPRAQMTRAFKV